MIFLKKYKKYLIYSSIFIIFYLIISLIYLLSNVKYNFISLIILIFNLITFAFIAYNIAKNNKRKGIVIGLIISSIIIVSIIILSLIFKVNFSYKNIIYYLLIVLTCTSSSIMSKNIKQ